jgi:SAM-dependent methyltransferase
VSELSVHRGQDESYLQPYLRAAREHGGGFNSLLWATPKSQRQRFDALCRIHDLTGKSVLDAGCGRADLLGYLLENRIDVADYTGIEAVDALADEAEARNYPACRIIRADFVREPARLFVGADVSVFSGSLNTLDDAGFYQTLSRAFDATAEAVVFNFLNSAALAGRDYLVWRRPEHVTGFLNRLPCDIHTLSDYLHGDCTVAVVKHPDQPLAESR